MSSLRPSGWVMMIGTRWHTDDLFGRLLAEMENGGEQWEVLSLPAQAVTGDPLGRLPGEWLWNDDAYGFASHLQNEKKHQSPRNWASLYLQTPIVEGGGYFQESWLRDYRALPDAVSRT